MVLLQKVYIHYLESSPNDAAAVRQVLKDRGGLRPGWRVDGSGVEFIVGSCEPASGGRYGEDTTEVIVGDRVLKVFEKLHVLPYQDTFKYNYDYMFNEHVVPFFKTAQEGEFTDGFEFSHEGCRFRVVATVPENVHGVAGNSTVIFHEGPLIERIVLSRVTVLPYEDGLPDKYKISKLKIDDEGIKRDYVAPYFAQKSEVVNPGKIITIKDVRFKVVTCTPISGGGVGEHTEIACQGVALRENFGKASAKTTPKSKAKPGPNVSSSRETPPGEDSSNGGKCTLS